MGVVFICLGLWFSIYYKAHAYDAKEFWNKILHTRLSESSYNLPFLIGGIAFIIFGSLAVMGAIRFK